jgi:hypothetical protein
MWLFDPDQTQSNSTYYQFTITHLANTFYEKPSEGARSLEIHCQAVLPGSIHANRQRLGDFGVRPFQRKALELYGIRFPADQIKVRFELIEPALESSRYITVDALEMTYRGKQVRSRRFPTETIPYRAEAVSDSSELEEEEYREDDYDLDEDEEFDESDWDTDDLDGGGC